MGPLSVPRSLARALAPALAAAVLAAGPSLTFAAAAEETDGPPVRPDEIVDTGRIERVAAALEDDPLFIDAEQYNALAFDEVDELRERIAGFEDSATPVRVAVVSALPTDESAGHPTVFLHALYDRTSEPGVYIALSESGPMAVVPFDVPVDPGFTEGRWNGSGNHAGSVGFRIEKVLDTLDEADAADPSVPVPTPDPHAFASGNAPGLDEPDSAVVQTALYIGLPLSLAAVLPCAVAGMAVSALLSPLRGGRRAVLPARPPARRPWSATPGGNVPGPVRARRAPAVPQPRWLTRTLVAEAMALEKESSGDPESLRILDLANRIRQRVDQPRSALVCAIAMIRERRAALAAPGTPPGRPCVANPLHGRAVPPRSPLAAQEAVSCHGCLTSPPPLEHRLLRTPNVHGVERVYRRLQDGWSRALEEGDLSAERLERCLSGRRL